MPALIVWDGGGTTNNASEAANWGRIGDDADVVPGPDDEMSFDSTSAKNCIVDLDLTVARGSLVATYTGEVTVLATSTLNDATDLVVQGGTLTIASSGTDSVSVGGILSLQTLGTLNLTPGAQLIVSGNWDAIAGVFAQSAGSTITFDSAGTQTLNTGASHVFGGDVVHSGAGTLQLVTTDFAVTGNFTQSAGTFDANGRSATVTGLTTVSGGTYSGSTAAQSFNGGLALGGAATLDGTNLVLNSDVTASDTPQITGNLDLGGGSRTFDVSGSGQLSVSATVGNGGLTKAGGGTLILSGNNPYAGTTTVNAGTLLVNGLQANSPVMLTGGTLGGTGGVGAVTATGGTLAPGASSGGLATADLSSTAAVTYALEINGVGAGQFDQLVVTGTVALGGAVLSVLDAPGTAIAGTTLVAIANDGTDPVVGTFAGLPEGALVTGSGGALFRVSYVGGDGNDVTLTPVAPTTVAPTTTALAVGAGTGGDATVNVYNQDGSLRFSLVAFEGFRGGVTVATGDVTGDSVEDVIVGVASGASGGHVKVFDGATGALTHSYFAFPEFRGGVSVGAGDVDRDGRADVIVGAGAGAAGGHVKVFSGRTGAEISSFLAFPDFAGGVTVAGGDINHDGFADIVVGANGAAPGGHVKVFDGATGAEVRSFFAFPGYLGGVNVAAGDLDGDGFAEIIVGAADVASHVKAFDGATGVEELSFLAFPGFPGGVRVGAADRDADSLADIVVGAGPGAGPHVKVFDGATLAELDSFFAFDPPFTGGVFVG